MNRMPIVQSSSLAQRADKEERKLGFARHGLTLIELVVVLVILAALAGITLPLLTSTSEDSAETATRQSLVIIRDALIRQYLDTKYESLPGAPDTAAVEANRFHLRWLFFSPVTDTTASDFDPDTRLGWNGPYLNSDVGKYEIDAAKNLTATYGADGDPAILDAYTRTPIVCQVVNSASPFDVRIVSAGPDGIVDIAPNASTISLTSEGGTEPIGDDIYVAFTIR